MKKRKLLAGILTVTMVLSLAACGGKDSSDKKGDEGEKKEENVVRVESANKDVEEGYMVSFEDDKFDFVSVNAASGTADSCDLSIEGFNGNKALKVTVSGEANRFPYVAIDASSLLGDAVADVANIQMDIAVLDKDGNFNACSGYIYAYTGEELKESSNAWSVYMEDQNPKLASWDVSGFVAGSSNFIQISKEEDSGSVVSDIYIDNIVFRDASGNPIAVDTSSAFDVAASSTIFSKQRDWSNLTYVTSEKEVQTTIVEIDEKDLGKPDGTATGTDTALVVTAKLDRNDNDKEHDFAFWKFTDRYYLITAYYNSEKPPVLIFKDMDGAEHEVTAAAVNDSNNMAQYTFADVCSAMGLSGITDMGDSVSEMDVRADGADLTLEGLTIGCERTIDDEKAIEVNQVLEGSGLYQLPLADLGEYCEGKPLKKIIIQFSGVLNGGAYNGVVDDDGSFNGLQCALGMSMEGYNDEANWFQTEDSPANPADWEAGVLYNQYGHGDNYRGTEEIIFEIPDDIAADLDYSYDGILQLGVWYMASPSATIDKIQFVTE